MARIRNLETYGDHMHWMLALIDHWVADDIDILCNLKFPVLSDLVETDRIKVQVAVNVTFDKFFPGLLKDDESCALAYLDLEAKVFSADEIGRLYSGRMDWPLRGGLSAPFWSASEFLYSQGRVEAAKKFWRHLSENAPVDSPYRQFARARLDPTKTELEDLWDQSIR